MPSKTLVKTKTKGIVKQRGPGKPPLFTPEELSNKIDEYWEKEKPKEVFIGFAKGVKITETRQVYTLSGLAYFCGFADRCSMYDLEKIPEYSHIIKRARTRIEISHEQNLQDKNCTGSIFWLKCSNWRESGDNNQPGPDNIPKTFNVQINYFLEKQGLPSIPLDAPKELGAFVDSGEISAPEEPTD